MRGEYSFPHDKRTWRWSREDRSSQRGRAVLAGEVVRSREAGVVVAPCDHGDRGRQRLLVLAEDSAEATSALAEIGASGAIGDRYGDAVGQTCIAVSGPVEPVMTLETGSADREASMWTFARTAIEQLEACLRKA